LIVDWAERCGDRVAIRLDDEALTYADLVGRGAALAAMLSEHTDDSPVMVACARRPESLAAIVGVLLAGRVCVPVDASDPEARIAELAERTKASQLVWTSPTSVRPHIANVEVLDMPADAAPRVALPHVEADDIAAILFTSGSTGRPKGVVYDHALLESLAKTNLPYLDVAEGEAELVANVAPFNYLSGFWCLFDLCHGCTLTMFDASTNGPGALADWIDRERLTTVELVASLARAVATTMPKGRRFTTLRFIGCYGEVLAWRDVELLREHLEPGSRILNVLGTTEAPAVTSHTIEWDEPIGTGAVPVGRPYANVDVQLDPVNGEIVVESASGLARGYWDDPELDAERFRRAADGTRTYRTGDLATALDGGALVHRGRIDDAVKVRGHLVEPLEVQLALLAIDGVNDATVLADSFRGRNRLIAHVALEPGCAHDSVSLRTELRRQLAAHLVPARLVVHDELPHTSRGKVDRQELRRFAKPARDPLAAAPSVVERAVAAAFRLVLECEVDVDSDFWEFGGDSLGAQELVTALADATGLELPLAALLDDATVAGVARRLEDRRPTTSGVYVALNATGSAPPIWCIAGGGGTSLAFRSLASALGPDQPLLVLEANGMQRRGRPDWTIEAAARRFARRVRAGQPVGPYRIVGYSYGGMVAYELGRRLRAAGHEVEFVALLDTPTPGAVGARSLAMAIGGKPGERGARARARRVRRALQIVTTGAHPQRSEEYFRRFFLIGKRACHRYRALPADFPLVVIQAAFLNADYWQPLVPEIDAEHVATSHLTLLEPPDVEAVAHKLRARLQLPLRCD